MKQTVEEAARDYLQGILETTRFEVNFYEDNYDAGARDALFDVTERSFIAGAEWHAKQSPWISVRDDLPKDYELKLILLRNGQVRSALLDSTDKNDFKIEYYWYDREADENFDFEDVIAWMPIPSFDQILEANKDVLQRIKEKGD